MYHKYHKVNRTSSSASKRKFKERDGRTSDTILYFRRSIMASIHDLRPEGGIAAGYPWGYHCCRMKFVVPKEQSMFLNQVKRAEWRVNNHHKRREFISMNYIENHPRSGFNRQGANRRRMRQRHYTQTGRAMRMR